MQQLISKKRHLGDELRSGSLGSPPNERLLHTLRPNYWFAAHLHVKFAAAVRYSSLPSPTPSRAPLMMLILNEKATLDWFKIANSLSSRFE